MCRASALSLTSGMTVVMNNPIDLSKYRKRKSDRRFSGMASAFVLGSLEHVLVGADKRGFILKPDSQVPMFFSVLTKKNALVGSCEFSDENRLVGYSLINSDTGKYASRDVSKSGVSAVGLTTLFFEELAGL